MRHQRSFAITFLSFLVVAAMDTEGVIILGADESAREENAKAMQATIEQMESIGLAMHRYMNEHETFPPPAIVNGVGKPVLSWRVAILPYLENEACKELWSKFHLDESWDSEHNKALIAEIPAVYRCATSKLADRGLTVYQVPHGKPTVFAGPVGIPMKMVRDGVSLTIGVVEVDDAHAVPWTSPDDLSYSPKSPARGLGGHFDGFFIAMTLDASAYAIPTGVDEEKLRGLFTPDGGEEVRFDEEFLVE